jgi:hypothetical protein
MRKIRKLLSFLGQGGVWLFNCTALYMQKKVKALLNPWGRKEIVAQK